MDAESSYPMWDTMAKVVAIGIIVVLILVAILVAINFVNGWLLAE